MTTLQTMTDPSLTEDDIAVLLFIRDIQEPKRRLIPIQRLHEDMENNYGWMVLDVKGSIKRLFAKALIAVEGSSKKQIALTVLGDRVAARLSNSEE